MSKHHDYGVATFHFPLKDISVVQYNFSPLDGACLIAGFGSDAAVDQLKSEYNATSIYLIAWALI